MRYQRLANIIETQGNQWKQVEAIPNNYAELIIVFDVARQSRWYRGYDAEENERGDHHDEDGHDDDHDDDDDDDHDMDDMGDSKAMVQPKADVWGGYYDFLINEGSYKFWAVFQVRLQSSLYRF